MQCKQALLRSSIFFPLHFKTNPSKSHLFLSLPVPTLLPSSSLDHAIPIRCSCNLHHPTNRPTKISQPQRDLSADQNIARSNWTITKLSREGKIYEARRVFDEMPHKDVVTWTTIISGYIKCGMMKEARILFDHVLVKRNVVTWTAMLAGYLRLRQVSEAEKLFEEMPERNVVSWNTMISGYAQNGRVDSACELFERMNERNVVSWNTIVTALAQEGRIDEARRVFDAMPMRDVISWTAMVAGLSQNGRIDEARELFDKMPERNVVSWNAMITGYMQNLRLVEALYLFERMQERDLPTWNTMITGFIQNGDLRRARKLFNEMREKNVVTWTSLITGYMQDGQSEEAMKIFSKMQWDGVKPNQGTFVSVLSACSSLAGLSEGKQIHQIISKTIFQSNAFVESALISMYSKCGEIGIAREVFDQSIQKDTVSWNGIIAAYAHHGDGREAIRLFEEMQENGFEPDDVTYVGVLSACSHSGLVDEGLTYFDALVRHGSIKVREDHYACLVDLCGRAGRLEEAVKFIDRLKTRPSACVWGALLGGCSVHGNVRIGKIAAKRLLEVEPDNAGTYMLLSNIYASVGRWKEAANVRLKMKDKGLKKQPGCSWIEVGNRVHVFVVGDKSHCQAKEIYCLLHDIHGKMKRAGYVPKKYYRDTAWTRHKHSRDTDFTCKKGSIGYDMLPTLKYPCIIAEKQQPTRINRAATGSLEEFLGSSVHYADNFPIQASFLPVTDTELNFSNVVVMRLNANDSERKFVIGEPSQAYTDCREAEGATNGSVWTSRNQKWNCLSKDLGSVGS